MGSETLTGVDVLTTQAHPWHGIDPIVAEGRLLVFIENVPLSQIKHEVDHLSGHLKVDHPQDTSSLPPEAYGFVPRTLCGTRVSQLNSRLRGDRAPLDVFVLSERPLNVPGVLAEVNVVGGIPVRDESFVDDKLITVLHRDSAYGGIDDISAVPVHVMERISHYLIHASPTSICEVGDYFGKERAEQLLQAAMDDYRRVYSD